MMMTPFSPPTVLRTARPDSLWTDFRFYLSSVCFLRVFSFCCNRVCANFVLKFVLVWIKLHGLLCCIGCISCSNAFLRPAKSKVVPLAFFIVVEETAGRE